MRRRWAEYAPRRLLPECGAAMLSALDVVIFSIAFAGLIFSGNLSAHLSLGINMGLASSAVIGLIIAFGGSFPGTIGATQEQPAVILGLAAGAIATSVAPSQVLPTILAMIVVSTAMTGVAMFLLGKYRLGGLVRFMPYPVIGGFLAGTGWLILLGAFAFMGTPLCFTCFPTLLSTAALPQWLPAFALGVALYLTLRYARQALLFPALLIGSAALFYVYLAVTGLGLAGAADRGWLIGPFSAGASRTWSVLGELHGVDWQAWLGQVPTMFAVVLISVIHMLLNATGIEVATRANVDFNRDLRSAGAGNLASALTGGMTGYPLLGVSVLNHRLGAATRFVALMTVALTAATLVAGAEFVGLLPRFLAGAILLFVAFDFLVEWIIDARQRCSLIDYSLILLILFCITSIGFLEGIGIGIAVSAAVFVVRYSRISAVKHELNGQHHRSKVRRPPPQTRILEARGDEICILQLQGYLFFGTASQLVERVNRRLADVSRCAVRYVVLDFQRVDDSDSSAVLGLNKLRNMARSSGFHLVLADVTPDMRLRLQRGNVLDGDRICSVFADLDRGLEWCEEQILAAAGNFTPPTLADQLLAEFADQSMVERLLKRLQSSAFDAGEYVLREGDPSDGIFFVLSGEVSIVRAVLDDHDTESGANCDRTGEVSTVRAASGERLIRFSKYGPGTLFGEVDVYSGRPRSASVIADQPAVVAHLSNDTIARIERDDPPLSIALHRFVASVIASRLQDTTADLSALLEHR